MAQDFLSPDEVNEAETAGESSMKASLAKGMPHGYEVGYRLFHDQWANVGSWRADSCKGGRARAVSCFEWERDGNSQSGVAGTYVQVVALDGNPVPNPAKVPVLWLGTAERISAIVEMNHPGVWVMGDLTMMTAGTGWGLWWSMRATKGKPVWLRHQRFDWSYSRFGNAELGLNAGETIDMTFAKENAAEEGFNRWTINGAAYPMTEGTCQRAFT